MAKIQAIGIDVDGSFVKVVNASLSGSKLTVDHALVRKIDAPIPEDGAGSGASGLASQDPYWKEVTEAIDSMVSTFPGKKKYAATAVSMLNTVTKDISFSASMSEQDILNSLASRLKSQLPSSLDDMFYDYEIRRESDGTKTVHLLAANKKQCQPKLKAMEFSGLIPIVLEVEGRMAQQLYSDSKSSSKNCLYLDLKSNSVVMYIYDGKELKFSKELPIAVPDSVQNKIYDAIITQKLNKLSGEVSDEELVSDIEVFSDIEVYRDSLTSALESELRLYSALHGDAEPDHLIYYGTGSIVPDLKQSFSESLDMQSIKIDIPLKLGFGRKVKKSDFNLLKGFYSQSLQLAKRACEGVSYV